MKELTRKDVPPGTWVIYKGGTYEGYLTVGNRYQISNCRVHQGDEGSFVNISGTKVPNPDGGFNVPMKDFTLAEGIVVNNYLIF